MAEKSPFEDEELSFLSEKDLNDHLGDGSSQYPSDAVAVGGDQGMGGIGGAFAGIGFIRQSSHPKAAFFHLLFKSLALLVYIFSGIFTSNFIFVAVLVILLLAFDFWTVKNVTGRLLVGLRWWSHVTEDGRNEWVFESLENMNEVNANDSRVFWAGLYIPVVAWGGLFVIDVLKFNLQWLVVVIAALSMHLANIIGYTKCSNDAKQRMKTMMDQGAAGLGVMQAFTQNSAFQAAVSGLFNGVTGGGGGGGGGGGTTSVTV